MNAGITGKHKSKRLSGLVITAVLTGIASAPIQGQGLSQGYPEEDANRENPVERMAPIADRTLRGYEGRSRKNSAHEVRRVQTHIRLRDFEVGGHSPHRGRRKHSDE